MKRVVLAALLAINSPVFAQGFVGIGFGQASGDISADPIGGVFPSVDDTDTSFKIFGGTMFTPNFGLEVGYVDLGELSVNYDDGVDFINATYESTAFYVAGLGMLPLNDQAGLFLKAGFARWDLEEKITSSLFPSETTSESGTDLMFGLGAQFAVNNLLLRAEFERFTDIGDENTTGQSDVDVIGVSAAVKF